MLAKIKVFLIITLAIEQDTTKTLRKTSLIKNLDTATKNVLKSGGKHKHVRHSSMEVKFPFENSPNSKTNKHIHLIKEMIMNTQGSKKNVLKPNKVTNKTQSMIPSSVIINQEGIPCFNNINIFTTNNNNTLKPGDINLRDYIFNKNTNVNTRYLKATHVRSKSNNLGF